MRNRALFTRLFALLVFTLLGGGAGFGAELSMRTDPQWRPTSWPQGYGTPSPQCAVLDLSAHGNEGMACFLCDTTSEPPNTGTFAEFVKGFEHSAGEQYMTFSERRTVTVKGLPGLCLIGRKEGGKYPLGCVAYIFATSKAIYAVVVYARATSLKPEDPLVQRYLGRMLVPGTVQPAKINANPAAYDFGYKLGRFVGQNAVWLVGIVLVFGIARAFAR